VRYEVETTRGLSDEAKVTLTDYPSILVRCGKRQT
jgi:hypothetical protein